MGKIEKYKSEGYDRIVRVINEMYIRILVASNEYMQKYAITAISESLNLCMWPVCVGLKNTDKNHILSQKMVENAFENAKLLFMQHDLYKVTLFCTIF